MKVVARIRVEWHLSEYDDGEKNVFEGEIDRSTGDLLLKIIANEIARRVPPPPKPT
jgi:hypothetical protein